MRYTLLIIPLLLAACQTNTVTVTNPDGTVTTSEYSNKAYRIYQQAELVRYASEQSTKHQQFLAEIKSATVKCPPPNLDGVDETAAALMAMAWSNCNQAPDNDRDALMISAATGNPLDPNAQMFQEAQRTERNVDNNKTARMKSYLNLAGVLGVPLIWTYRDIRLEDTPGNSDGGGDVVMGDGSSINITASNSGNQTGRSGDGSGGPMNQTRQMGISLTGDVGNSHAYAESGSRMGSTGLGPNLINDVSGTQGNVSDESNQGNALISDNQTTDDGMAPVQE